MLELFLEHYGVKGMHWGTRRGGSSSRSGVKKAIRPRAEDLSDEELKKLVNRLNLEKQYNSLINASSTSKGQKFAKEFLSKAGNAAVGTVLNTVVNQQVAKVLKRAVGPK